MTDMIARKNVSGSARAASRSRQSSSGRPERRLPEPATGRDARIVVYCIVSLGGIPLASKIGGVNRLVNKIGFYRFTRITREPQVPIGFDRSGPRLK